MRKLLLILIMYAVALGVSAKRDNVYFCDFGLGGGCGFVLGDVNGTLFNYVQPVGSAYWRYKFNGHWEIRVQGEGGILGVTKTPYYDKQDKMIYGGGQVVGEFNFFNYGVEKWKEYRSWFSPCIYWGLGFVAFNGTAAMTMPMGIGVKFKVSDRVNLGLYWECSKVFSDKLDYVDDPIGLNKGFWNNRDWYSTAQIFISINFLKVCAPCRNGVTVKKQY